MPEWINYCTCGTGGRFITQEWGYSGFELKGKVACKGTVGHCHFGHLSSLRRLSLGGTRQKGHSQSVAEQSACLVAERPPTVLGKSWSCFVTCYTRGTGGTDGNLIQISRCEGRGEANNALVSTWALNTLWL